MTFFNLKNMRWLHKKKVRNIQNVWQVYLEMAVTPTTSSRLCHQTKADKCTLVGVSRIFFYA